MSLIKDYIFIMGYQFSKFAKKIKGMMIEKMEKSTILKLFAYDNYVEYLETKRSYRVL